MALLFVDSFSHYNTAQLAAKYNAQSASPAIQSGVVRYGPSALVMPSVSTTLIKTLPAAGTTWVVGLALRLSTIPTSSAVPFITFLEGIITHAEIVLGTDGTFRVTRNGVALTDGASLLSIGAGVWYYVEAKVTVADGIPANSCQVNVNGVNWLNVATGQDTRNGGTGNVNNIRLAGVTGNTYFADLYVTNGTTLLGDCRVDVLLPSGNGSSSGLLGSDGNSTDNYALVDENPPTDDADYVESLTVGAKDLYALANLSATPAAIYGVQVNNYVRKTDAGNRTACAVVKSGATEQDQAAFAPADNYRFNTAVVENDPATGVAWTAAGVNALEAGIKVIS